MWCGGQRSSSQFKLEKKSKLEEKKGRKVQLNDDRDEPPGLCQLPFPSFVQIHGKHISPQSSKMHCLRLCSGLKSLYGSTWKTCVFVFYLHSQTRRKQYCQRESSYLGSICLDADSDASSKVRRLLEIHFSDRRKDTFSKSRQFVALVFSHNDKIKEIK